MAILDDTLYKNRKKKPLNRIFEFTCNYCTTLFGKKGAIILPDMIFFVIFKMLQVFIIFGGKLFNDWINYCLSYVANCCKTLTIKKNYKVSSSINLWSINYYFLSILAVFLCKFFIGPPNKKKSIPLKCSGPMDSLIPKEIAQIFHKKRYSCYF